VSDDVLSAIADRTSGQGVDVAFEASGVQGGLDAALASVRKGATVVNIALTEAASSVRMTEMLLRGTTLVQSCAYARTFPEVVAALERGQLVADEMITGRISLDDVVERGFAELVQNRDEHVKIIVKP
jgi:(R,R)-butanediol dehydrogenase/meso-butanediol dehydrogenase/diacetyl reductase